AKTDTPKPQPPKKPDVPGFKKPEVVRGIYLTAWSAASPAKMTKMIGLLDRTELNSVVIDIRDTGEVYFPVDDPMVKKVHAMQKGTLTAFKNPKPLMERLSKAGVYPIARVACFRDNYVVKIDPSRAVQLPNGKPWRDHSGHGWLDPYDKRNWDYIAKTVDYAMDIGFPEIQLDYVRFPSEGKSSTQVFTNKKKYDDPKARPDDVITAFANWMGERVRKRGCAYSADVFGIISSGTVDQGIGQTLEKIAAPFDLLCPMVYPSHFARGEYGIPNPNASPYAVIKKSLGDYKRRIPKTAIRPWLQDFSLGVKYGPKEVRAQIKAAEELGYKEFLLWNAGNRYTEGGLLKEKAVASKKVAPTTTKSETAPVVAGKPGEASR
ncbi:hypothetical protein EON82_18775, partial [bacterium]